MDLSQYYLTKHDLGRVGWVLLHAFLSFAIVEAIQLLPQINFGIYGPVIMLALMPLLQAAQRANEPVVPAPLPPMPVPPAPAL